MDMLSVLVDESVKIDDKVEIFGDTINIREVTTKGFFLICFVTTSSHIVSIGIGA